MPTDDYWNCAPPNDEADRFDPSTAETVDVSLAEYLNGELEVKP